MSRINSGEIFIAAILIVFGLLLLLTNIGLIVFDWGIFWSLLLILFGLWLIWRALVRPQSFFGNVYGGLGDYRPDLNGKEIRNEHYSHGFGDFDLDLTRAIISDGESLIRASLGFGDLTIIVPRDVAVHAHVSAGFGDALAFGQRSGGIGPHVHFQSDDYASAPRKLNVEANIGFGDVKVIRGG